MRSQKKKKPTELPKLKRKKRLIYKVEQNVLYKISL